MAEKLIFSLLAVTFFIIIFFKIIRKNDSNYIILLVLEAIGIAINFVEINLHIEESHTWLIIRYVLSLILPLIIIIMEARGFNFSELLSIFAASLLMTLGDTKHAKKILVKLVTKYPESYYGHKMLAECYEIEGGMRRAIDEYVTAVDLNKKDYKSYFKIADLLRDLGKKDEAITMLQNLINTKPDCYEASCLLGDLLCEQERFKEAASVYQDALKYNPASFELYYNLGIVYTRLSDFQTAKEMYEKAAAINHKFYGANYNLGLIAFIQRDYDAAEKYFENSLYGELEAMSYFQLAKIYMFKGEKDKAINFLNKAIELDPKLLKLVPQEKSFEKIRELISVSVKMDAPVEEEKVVDEEDEETHKPKKNVILEEDEKKAMKYLEDTARLVDSLEDNDSRQKLDERLDYIFNKEKKKKELEEYELEEKIRKDKEKEKEEKLKQLNERQKELGNN